MPTTTTRAFDEPGHDREEWEFMRGARGRSPRRGQRSRVASDDFLGRVGAVWNSLRGARNWRADDLYGGVDCLTEWGLVGTLGLGCRRPSPPPPDRTSDAKQSQTADEQHNRRRHLHGVLQEIDGRLCANRRRGGENQEQRPERVRGLHVGNHTAREVPDASGNSPNPTFTETADFPIRRQLAQAHGTDIALPISVRLVTDV